jgi:hypothetical protein
MNGHIKWNIDLGDMREISDVAKGGLRAEHTNGYLGTSPNFNRIEGLGVPFIIMMIDGVR